MAEVQASRFTRMLLQNTVAVRIMSREGILDGSPVDPPTSDVCPPPGKGAAKN